MYKASSAVCTTEAGLSPKPIRRLASERSDAAQVSLIIATRLVNEMVGICGTPDLVPREPHKSVRTVERVN